MGGTGLWAMGHLGARWAQPPSVQGRAHQGVERGQHPQRVAPAPVLDQSGGEGDEHRAGQPTQKRHGDDGAPVSAAIALGQHREGRCVQGGGPSQAHARPHRIKPGHTVDPAVRHKTQAHGQGAQSHHAPGMALVDPTAHGKGHHTFAQQGQAEGQRRLRPVYAECGLHRPHEQGKTIKTTAPGDQLRQRQPPHQSV